MTGPVRQARDLLQQAADALRLCGDYDELDIADRCASLAASLDLAAAVVAEDTAREGN